MANLTLLVLRNMHSPSIEQLLNFFESAPHLCKIRLEFTAPTTGAEADDWYHWLAEEDGLPLWPTLSPLAQPPASPGRCEVVNMGRVISSHNRRQLP